MRASAKGFTLLEMMVTVAIIGILAAIAIPNYMSYVRRGKVVEGHTALADYRVKMEQYYQDNRSYANGAACGVAIPATLQYFSLACTVPADGQSFSATASSKANVGLLNAGDYAFTVNDSNAKTTTKFEGVAQAATCWMLTKGQTC